VREEEEEEILAMWSAQNSYSMLMDGDSCHALCSRFLLNNKKKKKKKKMMMMENKNLIFWRTEY
jgi:hypothetical protein